MTTAPLPELDLDLDLDLDLSSLGSINGGWGGGWTITVSGLNKGGGGIPAGPYCCIGGGPYCEGCIGAG